MRDGFLAALGKVWTLDKEETLRVGGRYTHASRHRDVLVHEEEWGHGSPPASFHSEFAG